MHKRGFPGGRSPCSISSSGSEAIRPAALYARACTRFSPGANSIDLRTVIFRPACLIESWAACTPTVTPFTRHSIFPIPPPRSVSLGLASVAAPRPAKSAEPPDANPYVRWCGRGGVARRPLFRSMNISRLGSHRGKANSGNLPQPRSIGFSTWPHALAIILHMLAGLPHPLIGHHCGDAVRDAALLHDGAHVVLYGFLAQMKLLGHHLIGRAVLDLREDLEFAMA